MRQLLLDCLQAFMPLAVSDLSISLVPLKTPIPFVQLLNFSDLPTETPDLFAQNFEIIHVIRIAHLTAWRRVAKPTASFCVTRKGGYTSI